MRIRTLGTLRLEGLAFSRPKPLLLLAYLAIEGPKSRRHLAEVFFQGATDAMDALSTTLGRLKRIGEVTTSHGGTVGCPLPCDANEVLAALDAGALQEAIGAYDRPFLSDLDLPLAGELEEWVYGTREAIAGRIRGAHVRLAEAKASRGDFLGAGQLAARAYELAAAPSAETETLVRIHTLLVAADHHRAPEVRREAEAFGGTVFRAVEDARAHLHRADVGTSSRGGPVPTNVAAHPSSFVGRTSEVAEIGRMIVAPEVRLVTLLGPGGIGKSSLADEVARNAVDAGSFADGVFRVPLEPVAGTSLLGSAIAECLPMDLQGAELPFEQVVRFIGRKSMLLVLDGFEGHVAHASMVTAALARCPGLTVLVTTRERLHVPEEWLVPVEGLAFPEPGASLDDALRFDAVRFFLVCARRHLRPFHVPDDQLPHLLELCRAVEGMPLALELAASWVRHMSVPDIADELERGLDLLDVHERETGPRHRSVRTTIARSWALLTEAERAVLRRASVFTGGFRREAASLVTGATLPMLANLVDKSLLRSTPSGRFGAHPLLLQYAREQLERDADEASEVRDAHASFYMEFLERHGTRLLSGDRVGEAASAIAAELPNVRAAWAWDTERERTDRIQFALEPLTHFAEITSSQDDVLMVFRAVIARWADRPGEAHRVATEIRAGLGILLYRVGSNELGRTSALEASAILEGLSVRDRNTGLWCAWYGAGLTSMLMGDYRPDCFERANAIAAGDLRRLQERGDADAATIARAQTLLGISQCGAGMVLIACGRLDEAQRCLEEASAHLRPLASPYMALVSRLQHELFLASGREEEALACLRAGIATAERCRYATEAASLKYFVARTQFISGDTTAAARTCMDVRHVVERSGDRYVGTFLETLDGWLSLGRGDRSAARGHFCTGIAHARSIQAYGIMTEALFGLADTNIGEGRIHDGLTLLGFLDASPATPFLVAQRVKEACDRILGAGLPFDAAAVLSAGRRTTLDAILEIALDSPATSTFFG